MEYEVLALVVVLLVIVSAVLTNRWIRWPFSLRALYWCGGFSYIIILALPRIFVWAAGDTFVQVLFWVLMTIVFAWILAYQKI